MNAYDVLLLVITHIAAGCWAKYGFDEETAAGILSNLLFKMEIGAEDRIPGIYLRARNVAMAQRKGSFEEIQKQPPFSLSGEANLMKLVQAWLRGGEPEFRQEWSELFHSKHTRNVGSEPAVVTFSGGAGDSAENAIRIHAPTRRLMIDGEYWYLYYALGGKWNVGIQYRTEPDDSNRTYDVLEVVFDRGAKKRVFFDVT